MFYSLQLLHVRPVLWLQEVCQYGLSASSCCVCCMLFHSVQFKGEMGLSIFPFVLFFSFHHGGCCMLSLHVLFTLITIMKMACCMLMAVIFTSMREVKNLSVALLANLLFGGLIKGKACCVVSVPFVEKHSCKICWVLREKNNVTG